MCLSPRVKSQQGRAIDYGQQQHGVDLSPERDSPDQDSVLWMLGSAGDQFGAPPVGVDKADGGHGKYQGELDRQNFAERAQEDIRSGAQTPEFLGPASYERCPSAPLQGREALAYLLVERQAFLGTEGAAQHRLKNEARKQHAAHPDSGRHEMQPVDEDIEHGNGRHMGLWGGRRGIKF